MAVAGLPPTHRPGPLQSLRGDFADPAPGQAPLPVPYAVAGGSSVEIATGFSAIVTDVAAASKEIKDSVATLSLTMDKLNMFMETQRRPGAMGTLQREELVSAFQEAFLTTAAAVVTGMGGVPMGSGPPGTVGAAPGLPYARQGAHPGPPDGVGPFGEAPPSQGRPGRTTDQMRPGNVPEGRGNMGMEAYQENADLFGGWGNQGGGPKIDPLGIRTGLDRQGFDIGGIRQRIAGSIQRGLSSAQWGPDLAQDEDGRYRWRAGAEGGRGGQFASETEIADFENNQKLSHIVGKFGEGGMVEGITAAMPKAGAVLGGATAAVGAAWAASEMYESQRAANSQVQSILGGSNLEAMRVRGAQQAYGLSQRFTGIGADAANELYAGVIGVDEDSAGGSFNRGAALNFGQNNYSRMGMSPEESLRLIELAADNGETSLLGLADALERVTESARSAGVNADEARQKFTSYYQAAIQGGSGQNASTIASAMTTMQVGLGQPFQDMNLSSQLSNPTQMMLQAHAMGLSRPEYMAAIATPNGGAQFQAEAMQRFVQPLAGQALGPAALQAISGQAQEMIEYGNRHGTTNLPGARWDEISRTAMEAGADPFIAQQVVQQMTGQQMSAEDSIRYLIGQQTGIIDPTRDAEAAQQAGSIRRVSRDEREEADRGQNNALEDRIGGWGRSGFASGNTKRRHSNRRDYVGFVAETGVSSPIVEKLLKDHDDDRRFRVESADGPRVVDLDTAMSTYMDQLASGAAEIVAGAGEGETVADWAGVAGDLDASETLNMNSATHAGSKGRAKGKTMEAFERERAGKDDGKEVRVIIEPAPALEGFIRARVPGSSAASIDSARSAGTTPARTTAPTTRHAGDI